METVEEVEQRADAEPAHNPDMGGLRIFHPDPPVSNPGTQDWALDLYDRE
jgi:hypothetical protein